MFLNCRTMNALAKGLSSSSTFNILLLLLISGHSGYTFTNPVLATTIILKLMYDENIPSFITQIWPPVVVN
jgi:uncharacterized membrane protein